LLAMLWLHTPGALVLGLAVAVALVLLERQLGRWENQLLVGDGHPPRNALTRRPKPGAPERPTDQRS
jgi:hypothetical protein